MDPAENLRMVAALIRDKDYPEAQELLGMYWDWRGRGGFEPRGSDKRAGKLEATLRERSGGFDPRGGDARQRKLDAALAKQLAADESQWTKPRARGTGLKYRAVKWRTSSDETTPVGKWHTSRAEALADAYHDYAPHRRAFYEIESSNGTRKELTPRQYDKAERTYYGQMRARDARGVWG
jgi:hypothetical protein